MSKAQTAEHARLAEATGRAEDDLFSANPWYEWGPYLSERAWGTVREDYSESGDAWDYFPHDHARSRAYRWNEEGMAGISDIRHELCLALALWNGHDPILKERMFGLTGPQGNHGEDVKEYWWYLEGLPSHALLQVALPLPAGRVPVRRAREPRPRAARPGARAARHRRVRRRPVLVDRRHLRESVAERGADARRAREPRARRGHAPRAADALVPQHLVVGRGLAAPPDRGRRQRAPRRRAREPRRLSARGRARPGRRAARGALLRERVERTARLRLRGDHAVPEGRHQRPRRLGRRDRQSRGVRHEGRAPLRRDGARRRQGRIAAEAAPARAEAAGDLGRQGVRRRRRRARGRRGRVLRCARTRGHRRRAHADPAPGVRRARMEQADVPVQRAPLARRGSR